MFFARGQCHCLAGGLLCYEPLAAELCLPHQHRVVDVFTGGFSRFGRRSLYSWLPSRPWPIHPSLCGMSRDE